MITTCAGCIHLVVDIHRGEGIARCGLGHYDRNDIPQWYRTATIKRGRGRSRVIAESCEDRQIGETAG